MTTERRRRKEQGDALDILQAEHRALLASLETLRSGSARGRSASRKLASVCEALKRHARIELELFYPLLRGKSELDDLLDAARVEHKTIQELIVELIDGKRRNGLRAAHVEALAMYAAHHFRDEEENLFPRARDSGIDLAALGRRIAQRRAELDVGEHAECRVADLGRGRSALVARRA
jgi:Hemerythrin HHE cation binding domain